MGMKGSHETSHAARQRSLKRELSGILAREISFEGALVTINHVDVNSDLKSAHVFVSVLGSEKPKA